MTSPWKLRIDPASAAVGQDPLVAEHEIADAARPSAAVLCEEIDRRDELELVSGAEPFLVDQLARNAPAAACRRHS